MPPMRLANAERAPSRVHSGFLPESGAVSRSRAPVLTSIEVVPAPTIFG